MTHAATTTLPLNHPDLVAGSIVELHVGKHPKTGKSCFKRAFVEGKHGVYRYVPEVPDNVKVGEVWTATVHDIGQQRPKRIYNAADCKTTPFQVVLEKGSLQRVEEWTRPVVVHNRPGGTCIERRLKSGTVELKTQRLWAQAELHHRLVKAEEQRQDKAQVEVEGETYNVVEIIEISIGKRIVSRNLWRQLKPVDVEGKAAILNRIEILTSKQIVPNNRFFGQTWDSMCALKQKAREVHEKTHEKEKAAVAA